MDTIAIHLFIFNALGFLLMHWDKARARKHQWRVPERILFLVALLGGSIGIFLGMYTFRHKTKHRVFSVGIPVILFLQLALLIASIILYAS